MFASRARARTWLVCSWLHLAGVGAALLLFAAGRLPASMAVVFAAAADVLGQLLGRPVWRGPWGRRLWHVAHDAARELGLPANLLATAQLVVLVALVVAGITFFVWMPR